MPSTSTRGHGRAALALLLAIGLTAPVATAAAADTGTTPVAPREVTAPPRAATTDHVDGLIVELRPGRGPERARERLAQLTGRTASAGAHLGGNARTLDLDGPVGLADAQRAAERLEREGLVVSATPNVRMSIAAAPDDQYYAQYQWSLHDRWKDSAVRGVSAEIAWNTTIGSSDVVVAVLDTGVLAHPDIVDRLVPGYDFVDGDSDASDPGDWCEEPPFESDSSWHGTHVAGTIGATTDNGIGVAGVDQRARIQPVRVLGQCGGTMGDIIAGIRWAAGLPVTGVPTNPTPADVLNLSLGGTASCYTELQSAIDDATAAGSLVVVAAGNENRDAKDVAPANCAKVVTVASTSRLGDRAFYSNYGPVVDIAAPGGDSKEGDGWGVILSLSNTGTTTPGTMNYDFKQGTSMAAPHVAGVAALALSLAPTLSPAQLTDLLLATATPFPESTPRGAEHECSSDPTAPYHCGSGIVSAATAVALTTPVLSGTAGVEKVDLAWTASTHASGIAGYDLHRTTGSTCSTAAPRVYRGTKRTFTDTTVTAGTTYRYCVVARSVDKQLSALSNTVSATPKAAPAPLAKPSWPADTTLTFDLEGSDLRLAWPRANGTVDRYDVFRDGTRIATTTGRSFLVTGLKLDQRYLLQVRARNSSGSSPAIDRYVTPSGPFSDVDPRSPFRTDIAWLATAEITRGCGGDRFCPGAHVTRQQMAAFLSRGLGLTETSGIRFSDVPRDSIFATDIDKLATAGITLGCGGDRFCPGDNVTRQQMAAFLTRGLDLTATSGIRFSDVARGSAAERDIDRLATAGITLGCGGDRFCPGADVSRQQMAAFLRRGLAS
ncbi:S8 family serine peptidase [Nitriliruptor alkaliphilus]|uniref:S8 family serine peptidase n=1 Tax=Nitriliruptor alkaliphilus TaxID=427918 RepID=UPI0006970B25|nr:S8 family serine peptidase [Nitriliruptor alkaliphilus]